MKKILTIVLATLLLTTGISYAEDSAKSQYVIDRFQAYGYEPTQADIDYWSVTNRNIYGTLEQNLQRRFSQNKFLEDTSSTLAGEPLFGATPFRPSEFKTNLSEQKTEGHSDTTLKVTSITTKDGNTLSADVLGDTIVLSINPTGSNSEIVLCTGLTTATKTFTGCTFGQRFDQSGSTSANVKPHAPGEPVIISNSDTYLVRQYLTIDGNQDINGIKSVASTTEPISRLFFGDNHGAYLWYNTTTDQFGWASSTTEFQFNSEGTQFSVGPSMRLSSGVLDIATSSSTFLPGFLINNGFFRLATSSPSQFYNGWGDLFSATTTHPGLTMSTSTINGVLHLYGQATSTSSLTAEEWCDDEGGCSTSRGSELLYASSTTLGNVDNNSVTNIFSFSVPANYLTGTNQLVGKIPFEARSESGSGLNGYLSIWSGSTVIASSTITWTSATGTIDIIYGAKSASNLQTGTVTVSDVETAGGVITPRVKYTTGDTAIDMTAATTFLIKIAGQNGQVDFNYNNAWFEIKR